MHALLRPPHTPPPSSLSPLTPVHGDANYSLTDEPGKSTSTQTIVSSFPLATFFCCFSVTRPMNMYTTIGASWKCRSVCQAGLDSFFFSFFLCCIIVGLRSSTELEPAGGRARRSSLKDEKREEHWNCFKADIGKTFERQVGAHNYGLLRARIMELQKYSFRLVNTTTIMR